MNRWNPAFPLLALGVIGTCAIFSQPEGVRLLGPQTDGSVLLPTGWRIRPAVAKPRRLCYVRITCRWPSHC